MSLPTTAGVERGYTIKLKAFIVFSVLAALFILSMFYRVTNAVIAPNLVNDLRLNAQSLGILSGAFFYSFALMQIVMGVLLDRIGPRRVMAFFALVGASGAIIFGISHTLLGAFVGRVLLGMGMACALMGSLKVFVLRFSPQQFSTLSGTFISVGTLGSIAATSPLAYLTVTIGWRATFLWAGLITAALSLLIFSILKDGPGHTKNDAPDHYDPPERIPLGKLLRLVLGTLSFWQIGVYAFFRYGTFVALQGLWLGTYLMDVKGFTPVKTGNILLMLSIGYIAAGPLAGYLADRVFRSAKMTAFCASIFYTLCLVLLTGIVEIESPAAYAGLCFAMGFFNSPGTLAYTHVKELFPITISATVIAGSNFFVMAGGAVLMPVLGMVVEAFAGGSGSPPAQAYHLAFLICFLGMTASLIFYAFSKNRR